jgi:hypothetical protein
MISGFLIFLFLITSRLREKKILFILVLKILEKRNGINANIFYYLSHPLLKQERR